MISADLRRLVRQRAALRCEYCLLAEEDAYFPHEPDHVIAVKHGGPTALANLALLRINAPSRVEIRGALGALGRWPAD